MTDTVVTVNESDLTVNISNDTPIVNIADNTNPTINITNNSTQVATVVEGTRANYAYGLAEEIKQLEINFYSYQAGYLKTLYRMAGYNQNFESLVDAAVYDTFYIKFNTVDKSAYNWGDYIPADSTIILAVPTANSAAYEAILTAALGAPDVSNAI